MLQRLFSPARRQYISRSWPRALAVRRAHPREGWNRLRDDLQSLCSDDRRWNRTGHVFARRNTGLPCHDGCVEALAGHAQFARIAGPGRYRALVPFMFALLLLEHLCRD
jgi:hypothetical protein